MEQLLPKPGSNLVVPLGGGELDSPTAWVLHLIKIEQ